MKPTVEELKGILDTELEDSNLQSYIDDADVFIQEHLTGTSLSLHMLKLITKYLAAHMAVITKDRLAIKEEAGSAKVEYAGIFGEGLKSTSHGQMVIALDTTGTLASLGKKSIWLRNMK